ncbi:glycosidase [Vibrio sp. RE86]|uniref:alpha-amylase family glycosyl hydrolase n=1 Tax=Vibrio sp. RE86 TaxID=2607605 RepID=UPI001493CA8E|nr:alpha-amylase family glycosyl hydrolase [Vibrio sp. RE86]NOH79146.1 glycosidase [Vibrio sp. RE86]
MFHTHVKQQNQDENVKPPLSVLTLSIASVLLAGCSVHSDNEPTAQHQSYQCDTELTQQTDDLRIYQVMVESFVNGDKSIGHGTGYGKSHHMGDIRGIINSLDYIQSLGMNAIWLTPIFHSVPAPNQDHWADRLDATGYFATNYFGIDPRFGTMEDAKELVEQAHARGLYVFFDGVFGHHKESGAMPSPNGNLPSGPHNPVDYPQSIEFYKEVAEYWITELKIDGWRLDQAYQVPPEAWVEIREGVGRASKSVTYTNQDGDSVNPLGYMVAEVWAGENRIIETAYGSNEQPTLCSAFDFPVRYRLVETLAVNEAGVGGKSGAWLNEGMSLHELYPNHAKPNLMIGNHDLVRFGDLLQRGNLAQPEQDEYWLRHKAVFSFQAAYTGPITFYYGDEIGDQLDNYADKVEQNCAVQGLCDDHVARTSGKVEGLTAELNDRQRDLKQYVTNLMTLRESHSALYAGERISLVADDTFYVDHKQSPDEAIIFAMNLTDKEQTLHLESDSAGSLGQLTDLMSNTQHLLTKGKYSINLAPFEARFLSIEKPSETGPIIEDDKVALATGVGFMAQCDNPTLNESGPVNDKLYLVGDFSDSGWKHKNHRAFEYKGDGVYQVVTMEKPGSYRMQYAAQSWSPQFTADGLSLKLGVENSLIRSGYGKDTAITLREGGQYVWSLKFDNAGTPEAIMASKCPTKMQ